MTDSSIPDECDCPCHSNPDMKHCSPCCDECPICRKRIKMASIPNHKKECQPSGAVKDFNTGWPPNSLVMEITDELNLTP